MGIYKPTKKEEFLILDYCSHEYSKRFFKALNISYNDFKVLQYANYIQNKQGTFKTTDIKRLNVKKACNDIIKRLLDENYITCIRPFRRTSVKKTYPALYVLSPSGLALLERWAFNIRIELNKYIRGDSL